MPVLIDYRTRNAIMIPAKETAGQEKFEGKNSVSDKDVKLEADE